MFEFTHLFVLAAVVIAACAGLAYIIDALTDNDRWTDDFSRNH